jgi:hypothetical protein
MINGQKAVHAAEIAKIVAHEARKLEIDVIPDIVKAAKEAA